MRTKKPTPAAIAVARELRRLAADWRRRELDYEAAAAKFRREPHAATTRGAGPASGLPSGEAPAVRANGVALGLFYAATDAENRADALAPRKGRKRARAASGPTETRILGVREGQTLAALEIASYGLKEALRSAAPDLISPVEEKQALDAIAACGEIRKRMLAEIRGER